MTTRDPLDTYKQFLTVDHLSRTLLMKYGAEASKGQITIYGDIQVEEGFVKVCHALGYELPAKLTRSTPIRSDEAA